MSRGYSIWPCGALSVWVIPVLSDNLAYAVVRGDFCAVIDPGEAAPVLEALGSRGYEVSLILLTHHHADHVAGVAELRKRGSAPVFGPDDPRLAVDRKLQEGDLVEAGGVGLRVWHTPGHTRSHLALVERETRFVFSGDTLFTAGCGRIFDGSSELLFASLLRLSALPEHTALFCGHDMTEENLRFALSLLPRDRAFQARHELCRTGPNIPSTMGEERRSNIFLRAGEAEIARAVGLPGHPPAAVFAELRRRKDQF